MNGKILILLVTLVFLFASGCAEEDNTSSVPDDPDIPVPEAGRWLTDTELAMTALPASLRILLFSILQTHAMKTT